MKGRVLVCLFWMLLGVIWMFMGDYQHGIILMLLALTYAEVVVK